MQSMQYALTLKCLMMQHFSTNFHMYVIVVTLHNSYTVSYLEK